MDRLQRMTFRFDGEIEVRYLPRPPQPGDFVAHTTELWVVVFVSADAAGVTVVCELLDGNDRHAQNAA
jgi:hypothetical protein